MSDYEKKVARAIRLLKSIPTDEGPVEVSYSGGKDSDVILELTKMAGIPYRAIYKNTTIDPPGTIAHCRKKGVEIIQPKESFMQLVARKGFPSRFSRFCCQVLKEYKVLDRAIQGIRRSESIKRRDRYREPEICRVYSKDSKAKIYLPILEWTDEDVARFVAERNIECHPLYYDENGMFRVERRLGCIGCPMKSDNGRGDYLRHPTMLKARIKAHQKYLETHPNSKTMEYFGNSYNATFFQMFCNNLSEYRLKMSTDLWGGQLDAKKFLEEYFNVEL
jgi:phosphoadenosine phosphosulfate reductase